MAEDMQTIFAAAGYTYPGTPEAGARLLLSIASSAQEEARAERAKYSELVSGLHGALSKSPIHRKPGDPLRHIALLCERLDEGQVASLTNIVEVLRARHPTESFDHPDDDRGFLAALDELTDPQFAEKMKPLIDASVAYWQALERGNDAPTIAAAHTKWSHAVSRHLELVLVTDDGPQFG